MTSILAPKVFSPPEGKRYARIPCDFSARCKAAGLSLYERAVLMNLMCYQAIDDNGRIVLVSGSDGQIAADTGIAPNNVRKALTSLRKKGAIATIGSRRHLLLLDLWNLNDAASAEIHHADEASDSASPEKQTPHLPRCRSASHGTQRCISQDAHKERMENKNLPNNESAKAVLLDP